MEWWQRNKDFALKVGAGVLLFLVAWMIRGCTTSDPARKNAQIGGFRRTIRENKVPTAATTRATNERIMKLDEEILANARSLGKVLEPNGMDEDALQRDFVSSILNRIGKTDPRDLEEYMAIGETSRFSRLYDEVRKHYRRMAIRKDAAIDEDLGFEEARFDRDDILRAFHALDLATRAVESAVMEAGVEAVEKVSIKFGKRSGAEGTAFIQADTVSITLKGKPAALVAFLNTLNEADRFVPIRGASFGAKKRDRRSGRALSVQATFDLAAIRFDLRDEEEE
jgi:hypothetical protein